MDISYTSKLFSLRHSSEYKLSIQASLNGFSFCVYDFTRDTFLLLKHVPVEKNNNQEYYLKELVEIIKKEEIFNHKFKQVNFVYFSQNYTVIPEELAVEEELKNHLAFQHEMHEYDELHYDNLPQNNSTIIYSVPSIITNAFLDKFETVNYKNQNSVLLKVAHSILVRESLSELCLINKTESFFDIIIYKDKKLELCNTFNYVTENDLVYFCISTLKNLGLAESGIPVYYSGNFRTKGQDTLMMDKFIKVFKKNEPFQIKKVNNIDLFTKYPVYLFTPLYFVNF